MKIKETQEIKSKYRKKKNKKDNSRKKETANMNA
jgi:hypothetical protein